MDGSELQPIAEGLRAAGALAGAVVADDGKRIIEGEAEIVGHGSVRLRVDLAPPFPLAEPDIHVLDWAGRGSVAHVDSKGKVCYLSHGSVVLDWQRPVNLAVECVHRAKQVLGQGLATDDWSEYVDEYEAHWRQRCEVTMPSLIEPADEIGEVLLLEMGKLCVLARDSLDWEWFLGKAVPRQTTIHRGLFLPLENAMSIVPVPVEWTTNLARKAILRAVSPSKRAVLARVLKKHGRRNEEYVVLQVPRDSGEPALVGLCFLGVGEIHPLLDGGAAQQVRPIELRRWDSRYILRRGGAMETLSDKSVCLVGCGAIGSKLASELVHAGVLRITLVDPDKLSEDNTFRHMLGRESWEKNKAEELARWFRANIPYSRVTARGIRFDEMVADKVSAGDLDEHDIFVLCTGDATFELWANQYIRSQLCRPVLSAWLEPLGIGGHSLISVPASPGCLQCLHTGGSGEFVVNRASFANPDQDFGEDISGCGSQFVPFASLDATETASLAARMIIEFLRDGSKGARLRSWRGDAAAFLERGYALSGRFDAWDGRPATDIAHAACPVCGSDRGATDD